VHPEQQPEQSCGSFPPQSFDIIAINPPYYKKDPRTPGEYAWYCGEHGEYFERLFGGLRSYSHPGSEIVMILCDGCDLEMIMGMAARQGFGMRCSFEKRNWVETNFIFAIERTGQGDRPDLQ
jgi:release factor glutamine methyltransferase